MRPVRISDEPLVKDFFYSLSDQSLYRRFISMRKDMPTSAAGVRGHRLHQGDGHPATVREGKWKRWWAWASTGSTKPTIPPRWPWWCGRLPKQGGGTEVLSYLTFLAKREGLYGFTAEVLVENKPMLHLFEKMGFDIQKQSSQGVYELQMAFRGPT